MNSNIKSISLFTSSICNLNCSYCYLYKNSTYNLYDKEIVKSWEDGTYLQNVEKSLKKLNLNFDSPEIIQFWGGETLIHIDKITPNLEQLLFLFPNINELRISTNWLIDINNFIDFVKKLDQLAHQEIELALQLSIDGPEGPCQDEGHHGSWDVYKKNINLFAQTFNNFKLNNVIIKFRINATMKKDLYFSLFSTYESMKNYLQYMFNFINDCKNKFISKNLIFDQDMVFPALAVPGNFSTEDGIKLAGIVKLWECVWLNEFKDIIKFPEGMHVGLGMIAVEEILFGKNAECSELVNGYTIIPDGTIVECNSTFIYAQPDYGEKMKKEKNISEWYRYKLSKAVNFNPQDKTDTELQNYDWIVLNGYKNTTSIWRSLMLATIDELALSGQISYKYHLDKNLSFRHGNMLSHAGTCTRDCIRDTHIPYMSSLDNYRRYLNGVLDFVYDNQVIIDQEEMEKNIWN